MRPALRLKIILANTVCIVNQTSGDYSASSFCRQTAVAAGFFPGGFHTMVPFARLFLLVLAAGGMAAAASAGVGPPALPTVHLVRPRSDLAAELAYAEKMKRSHRPWLGQPRAAGAVSRRALRRPSDGCLHLCREPDSRCRRSAKGWPVSVAGLAPRWRRPRVTRLGSLLGEAWLRRHLSPSRRLRTRAGDRLRPSFQARANAILAYSLVHGLPRVDPDRTAVTGISRGRYLTCIPAAVTVTLHGTAAMPIAVARERDAGE